MRPLLALAVLALLGCAQAPPAVDVIVEPAPSAGTEHPPAMQAPSAPGSEAGAPDVAAAPVARVEPPIAEAGADDVSSPEPAPDDSGLVTVPEAEAPSLPPPPPGTACTSGEYVLTVTPKPTINKCIFPTYADSSACQGASGCSLDGYAFPQCAMIGGNWAPDVEATTFACAILSFDHSVPTCEFFWPC